MRNTRAAYRYALAILSVAEETKQIDVVTKDFEQIERLLHESNDFLLFLRSPVISTEKKKSVLEELFKGKVSDLTSLFMQIMTTKNRENILPEIIKQFIRLRDDRLGILTAEVRTAVDLTAQQQQALIASLTQRTGKQIRLKFKHDPSLLGGLTVQYEDTVLDGSVRHQLDVLAERFTAGTA